MTSTGKLPEKNHTQYALNVTLAVVAGQVGCLTLVVILAALFGGLWLDQYFQSKPLFTIILMLVSVPVTVAGMIWVVRSATARIRPSTQANSKKQEESAGGR